MRYTPTHVPTKTIISVIFIQECFNTKYKILFDRDLDTKCYKILFDRDTARNILCSYPHS